MKNIFCILLLLPIAHFKSVAQAAPVGIYLNAADFTQHKLSYTPVANQKYSIRLHNDFYKPYVTVITGTHKTSLCKDSIFGYCLEDSTAFRFFHKEDYAIINQGSYPILYKQSYMPGGKGARRITEYYFSRDETAAILPLTKKNLRIAFSDNPSFLQQIADTFRTDEDLIEYNNYLKAYKLVALFQKQQLATH